MNKLPVLILLVCSLCANSLPVSARKDTKFTCNWTKKSGPQDRRWIEATSSTLRDGRVMFAGGSKLDPATGHVISPVTNMATAYDVDNDKWLKLPDLLTARAAPAAGVIDGTAYVFGGSALNAHPQNVTDQKQLDSVESLRYEDHFAGHSVNWTEAAKLPTPRTSPSAASLPDNKAIVIAGGFTSETTNGTFSFQYLNDAYLFDGKVYHQLADMPFKRSNMALVAADGGVYAVGGGATNPSYNNCAFLPLPSSSDISAAIAAKWTPCEHLLSPVSWAASGTATAPDASTVVVVAGGMDGTFTPTNRVELHTAGANWTQSASCDMPFAAGFLAGANSGGSDGHFVLFAGGSPSEDQAAFVLELQAQE